MPLEEYEDLIVEFCESSAFEDSSHEILSLLDNSRHRLPGIVCLVCEKFLDKFGREASNISTRHFGDGRTVASLLFRVYQQHRDDEWSERCLDLIDKMCLNGIQDVKDKFDDYER